MECPLLLRISLFPTGYRETTAGIMVYAKTEKNHTAPVMGILSMSGRDRMYIRQIDSHDLCHTVLTNSLYFAIL